MTIGQRSDVWWCRGERATRWRAVTRHGVSGENDELLAHSALRTLTQRGGQWRLHADHELTEWVSDHEGDYQAIRPLADRYRESWGALRRRDDVWVIGRVRSVDAGSDVWRALMAIGHRLMIVMDLNIYSSRDARRDVTRLAHRAEVEERWRLRQGFESGRLSDRWMSVVQRRRDAVVSGDDLVEATVTVMVAATTRHEADRLFQDCVDVAAAHGALLDRGWGCQAPWFAESYGPVSHG
jgi:hypothetical protein